MGVFTSIASGAKSLLRSFSSEKRPLTCTCLPPGFTLRVVFGIRRRQNHYAWPRRAKNASAKAPRRGPSICSITSTAAAASNPANDDIQALKVNAKPGAGEGIRTLDPNLGKVVLYP